MKSTRGGTKGYILLEVLVTIVILVIGLLGIAGLQVRVTVAENEAYQRAQALVLAQDLVDRIYANRANAATYVMNDIGIASFDCTTVAASVQADICEWHTALTGAAEKSSGASIGTLLGGRGCVTAGGANEYFVTVVWQGYVPTVAPSAACGSGAYGTDTLRRAISMRVLISDLNAGTLL
jgi:type IV pilus assembly protein PilV